MRRSSRFWGLVLLTMTVLLIAGALRLWSRPLVEGAPQGRPSRPVPGLEGRQRNTVLPRGAIPAIDAPPFTKGAADSLPPDDLVIGVLLHGDARAYPITILSTHEIVNDEVGGIPVAVTWCPLCFTAILFERMVGTQELSFEVSGQLLNENLVMVDRESDSLWSQLNGQAIEGPLEGTQLNLLTSELTSWQAWHERHPESLLLDREVLRERFDRADYAVDPRGSYDVDPYEGYYISPERGAVWATIPRDLQDTPKRQVIGVIVGDTSIAYPLDTLTQPLLHDEVAGVPLLLVRDSGSRSAWLYERTVDGQRLDFTPLGVAGEGALRLRDEQTGTIWDGTSGRAIGGPLEGVRLSPLPATPVFLFAWKDFYPDTRVYEGR